MKLDLLLWLVLEWKYLHSVRETGFIHRIAINEPTGEQDGNYKIESTRSRIECGVLCDRKDYCSMFSYNKVTHECYLGTESLDDVVTGEKLYELKKNYPETCPAAYSYNSRYNICYKIGTQDDSWIQHNASCATDGGHLIYINSLSVFNWLQEIITTNYAQLDGVHVDGTDADQEDVFKTHKGSVMTWIKWCPSSPEKRSSNHDCLIMDGLMNYTIFDDLCTNQPFHDGYVCQIDV